MDPDTGLSPDPFQAIDTATSSLEEKECQESIHASQYITPLSYFRGKVVSRPSPTGSNRNKPRAELHIALGPTKLEE